MTHTDHQFTAAKVKHIPHDDSTAPALAKRVSTEISEAGFRDVADVLAAYLRERQRADKLEAQLARFESCERSTADEF